MAFNDLNGNLPLYILVIAALTGVVVKTTADRGTPENAGTSDAAKASAKAPEGGKGSPAAPDQAAPEGAAPDPTDVVGVLQRELATDAGANCAVNGDRLESLAVVIALLPDPATSGYVAEFDHGLAAVQESAQSQSFTVVRYWLPWDREGESLRSHRDAQRAGWLLMRDDRPDARQRLLVILIVGERVGAGVQRAMLEDALAIQTRITPASPLLILGPSFSGTATSLRDVLETWCEDHPSGSCGARRAEIISGTATRWFNAAVLESTRGLSVRFQATVNPADALSDGMHRYLREALDVPLAHMAQLTETSTPFGVGSSKPQNAAARAPAEQETPPPLSISFPAHLPQLRPVSEDKAGASQPNSQPDEISVDAVPTLATTGLTESKQLLAGTIEALRSRGITHVGVLATGTDDKVSLVTALRQAAPDIRPHIYEANLTLADAAVRQAMDGTLVASSYPLTAMTQIWSLRPDIHPFASDAAEGVHNALLALLWRGGHLDEDSLARSLRDYRYPFDAKIGAGPPVWISVIVAGHVWPLAVYPHEPKDVRAKTYVFGQPAMAGDKAPPLVQGTPARPQFERSRFANILLVLVLLLVVGNLLPLFERMESVRRCRLLLFYEPAPDPPLITPCAPPPAGGAPLRPRASPTDDGFLHLTLLRDADARPALLLGIWITSLVGWAMATIYELPRLLGTESSFAQPNLLDLLAVLLLIASTVLLFVPFRAGPPMRAKSVRSTFWQRLTDPGHWIRSALHAALIVGTIAVALYVLTTFIRPEADAHGRVFFFFVRLMSPRIGLTPVPSLAVMACAIYVACIFRLRVVRRGTVLCDRAQSWKSSVIPDACEGMRDFARSSLSSLTPVIWLGAGLGAALYLWRSMCPRTLEGPLFDRFLAVGFGIMFAIAMVSLWRADRLCKMLADYTRGLAAHPLAPAFSTLPAHISQTFRTPMPGRIKHAEFNRAAAVASEMADNNPLPQPERKRDPDRAAHDGPPAPAVQPAGRSARQIHRYLDELEPTWLATGMMPPPLMKKDAGPPPLPVQLREHVLALRMTESLAMMCDATRTTLFVGSVAALAATLAVSAYPFQPIEILLWPVRLTIAIAVVVAMRVLGSIERDDILSRIAGTEAGKLTPSWSLAARYIGYVIIPLGSLATTYLPDHGQLYQLLRAVSSATSR